MRTIAILGTMDTKGEEHGFVAEIIRLRGHAPLVIDVGALEAPKLKPDVPREEVARAAGVDLAAIVARRDRGEAVAAMARGATATLTRLHREGRIDGVISLGGGGGTSIATAAMQALPIGFPKLMVSTLASGNTAPYVGVKDIVMMPSIVDVAGLNRISRTILTRAAGAICGMVESVEQASRLTAAGSDVGAPTTGEPPTGQLTGGAPVPQADKPIIVASMFGNTTKCVEHARRLLEQAGYEVLIFHATGTGGRTMESLIEAGLVAGVLDVTTTEWADELVGGILSAGPTRCEAAARHGVPAILAPGCLDMVNFQEPESVPAKFKGRRFYQHNPKVTLMRTTPGECAQLGRILAEKCNLSTGPVTVLLPRKAISVISAPGQPFHDPVADEALFRAWKENLRPGIRVVEMDCEINDPQFAEACVRELIANISAKVH
jgi:uncharacterized protein (UPF0261 family)